MHVLYLQNTNGLFTNFVEAYVEEIYDTLLKTPRKKLEEVENELRRHTPEPMHMMLSEKQAKVDAITLFRSRKRKLNTDCPPTCTDEELQDLLGTGQEHTAKKRNPLCKKCAKPMKGHKKGSCQ